MDTEVSKTDNKSKRIAVICIIIASAIFIAIIVKKEAEGRKIDAENAVVAEKIAEKHC